MNFPNHVLAIFIITMGMGCVSPNIYATSSSVKNGLVTKALNVQTLEMTPYSGSGKLPVGLALEKLLPTVSAIYLNSNLNMNKIVSWRVIQGTLGQALDDIFHPLQLEWYLTDNSLTITRAAVGAEQIITTITHDPQGTSTITAEKIILEAPNKKELEQRLAQSQDLLKSDNPHPSSSAIRSEYWILKKGETIRAELTKWAEQSDWSLVWQFDKDWVIPANSEFTGSFDLAAAKVVETLASNGILIHANFFNANKTLVITGPGVTPQ